MLNTILQPLRAFCLVCTTLPSLSGILFNIISTFWDSVESLTNLNANLMILIYILLVIFLQTSSLF